jgi:hypothetical protein
MNLWTLLCTSALMAAAAYPVNLLVRSRRGGHEAHRPVRRNERAAL